MEAEQAVATGAPPALEKMPGHWVLARMGKRVLRPGGIELTRRMLDALEVSPEDDVVELAPGLGVTARLALAREPRSYTAVERDAAAAEEVRRLLAGPGRRCVLGAAETTGLEDASASVVYGEAMLTMQTPADKRQIVAEAFRVLRPGGRYGIHELCLQPDDLAEARKQEISRALSGTIRVGARPLTPAEWRQLLEEQGFTVRTSAVAPMHLLEPRRILQDEGLRRTLLFLWNVARTPEARRRVRAMRAVFRTHARQIAAVMVVAVRPGAGSEGA